MQIFHILTVTPIDVASDELPAVRYGDYMVAGDSLQAAFADIKDYGNVLDASEVYGAQMDMSKRESGVIVRPESSLNQRVLLAQHRHWSNTQERYILLATGKESPEQYVSRRFAETHPQFA